MTDQEHKIPKLSLIVTNFKESSAKNIIDVVVGSIFLLDFVTN